MYIKIKVKCLVVYAKCQVLADVKGDKEACAYHGQRMRRSLDDIDLWADMAEAALAYIEHQAATVHDSSVDSKAYMAERKRLWDAFVTAREKAKAMNQQ